MHKIQKFKENRILQMSLILKKFKKLLGIHELMCKIKHYVKVIRNLFLCKKKLKQNKPS